MRNIVAMVTKPVEFVLTEQEFVEMQDSITDAIVAAITPGNADERLMKVVDIICTMRNNLFLHVTIRKVKDE